MRTLFIGLCLFFSGHVMAQDISADSLLLDLTQEQSVSSEFFPEKMMWTQRALWVSKVYTDGWELLLK